MEFRDEVEEQDSQDGTQVSKSTANTRFCSFTSVYTCVFVLQELPEESFPVLAEEDEDMGEEGVSQSVPSFQMSDAPSLTRDVIVLDTDSESRESKEGEEIMKQDNEGEDQEEEEEEAEEVLLLTTKKPAQNVFTHLKLYCLQQNFYNPLL